jgi:hypothetical protein
MEIGGTSKKTRTKTKKDRSSPDENWITEYRWLEIKIIDKKKFMFCKWCVGRNFENKFTKGTTNYRKESITQHMKIQDHIKALDSISRKSGIIFQFKTIFFGVKNNKDIEEWNVFYEFISRCNLYNNDISILDNPNLERDDDNYIELNKNRWLCLKNVMANVIEKYLFEEINKLECFGLSITEFKLDGKMFFVVALYYTISHEYVERYIGLIETNNNIIKIDQIKDFLINKKINLANVFYLDTVGKSFEDNEGRQ